MLPGAYPPERCINSAGSSALCETGRVAAGSELFLEAAIGLPWFCHSAFTFPVGILRPELFAGGGLNAGPPEVPAGEVGALLPEATKELKPVDGYLFDAA